MSNRSKDQACTARGPMRITVRAATSSVNKLLFKNSTPCTGIKTKNTSPPPSDRNKKNQMYFFDLRSFGKHHFTYYPQIRQAC